MASNVVCNLVHPPLLPLLLPLLFIGESAPGERTLGELDSSLFSISVQLIERLEAGAIFLLT